MVPPRAGVWNPDLHTSCASGGEPDFATWVPERAKVASPYIFDGSGVESGREYTVLQETWFAALFWQLLRQGTYEGIEQAACCSLKEFCWSVSLNQKTNERNSMASQTMT